MARDPRAAYGPCNPTGCHEQMPQLHTLSYATSGWNTPTQSQILHLAMTRSLRECSLAICTEDATPFWPKAQARRGLISLRMGATVAPSEVFRRHKRREGKTFQLDLTVVKPCASTNLDKRAKRSRSTAMAAVKRK